MSYQSRVSRVQAAQESKQVRVRYEASYPWSDGWQQREMSVSRPVMAQAMYRRQSYDVQGAAGYAVYWSVVGEDRRSVSVRGVQVMS